jgi:hypothetical protein
VLAADPVKVAMTSSSIDKKGGVTLAWKGFTNVQEAWSVAVSIAGPK